MRLEDAVAQRPPHVTADDYRQVLLTEVQRRLLKAPEVPASVHIAAVHESFLDAHAESVGSVRKKTLEPELDRTLVLVWRLAWICFAACYFESWGLIIVGGLITVFEPKPTLRKKEV